MRHKLPPLTVEIKPSQFVAGEVGLFAARDISQGEKICPATAEEDFLTDEEFNELSEPLKKKVRAFTVSRPGGYLVEENVDFNELPISYFSNHSCEGNMGFDNEGDFMALRDIRSGEELTYDYGLIESGPGYRLECQCGAAVCRKLVTGEDHKKPDFIAAKGRYLYPDLRGV